MQKKENQLQKIISPIVPEFKLKDILQIIIGAVILAIPVGFTEETWILGRELPLINVLFFFFISLLFIAMFSYYNYHRHHRLKEHFSTFASRVLVTYFFSFLVVATLLTLINKAQWHLEFLIALKRTIIVTFPSSMSAVIADTL
jgi:uncharacterized membrane protein